jgi:hypothetical protein
VSSNVTGEYVDHLPEPGEACVAGVREILALPVERRPQPSARVRLRLKYVEAPSAILASEMQLGLRAPGGLDVTVETIQRPDPRVPYGSASHVLWRYEGAVAIKALNAPRRSVADPIVELAGARFHMPTWYETAGAIAGGLGKESVQDLLATMVHPGEAPDGIPAWDWVRRVQIASALVLAQLQDRWDGGIHREALFAVAEGPMDWAIDAVVLALSTTAQQNKSVLPDVTDLFVRLLKGMPDGYCCYERPLLLSALRLPDLPRELKEFLEDLRARSERAAG